MLLIVVIVGVVVCVFLGHFAFSYHKQEKTVRREFNKQVQNYEMFL